MNRELVVGKILQLELTNEILVGRIVFYDNKRGVVELDNVKNFDTGYCFAGSQLLSVKQIVSIRSLEDGETSTDSSEQSNTPPTSHINTTDVDNIIDQTKTLQYIKNSDTKYHNALKEIRAQSEIAVYLEPTNSDRRGRTSLIVIATHTVVYIFDMQLLGSHCRELCAVLEAHKPRKVVHYSHQFVHQLNSLGANVNRSSIFDTSVAYCLAMRTNEPPTFVETIHKCFNIAPKFLSNNNYHPYRRPLEQYVLETVAKRAILLLKLQQHLLHEKLLAPFYRQCESVSYDQRDNCEIVSSSSEAVFECIDTSWTVGDD